MLNLFEKSASERLSSLDSKLLWSQKVEEILVEWLEGDVPLIRDVAKQLAVSTRTLQLYLKNEGSSYSELLDKAREKLASQYLKNMSFSIDEIAYLLGFSETSAFSRAFKRWTSHTPREFREYSTLSL